MAEHDGKIEQNLCLIFSWENQIFKAVYALHKKATIHQVTTMLATSKNVLIPGHNHPSNHQGWWLGAGAQI